MPKATTAKKSVRRTKFATLKSKKAAFCKGKTTKAEVRKAASEYEKDAVKKGNKTKAQAKAVANRVLNAGCKMSSVAGKKKRKSPARKRKTTKRKAR